ncbi:phage tail protein [Shewanella frigidimarina]|uniref:Phage tail protein n=1 Tax=Shewanella frigidimarina TaxID=56812 RepID=A0A106C1H9_SHEFR|nr:tail fiber protein [Shewanella frigidimarina]KVX02526.1 phage tail protein [Shewanella frigidimarina]
MSEPFIGEIRAVSFSFAPQGWAFCNGQLLQVSQNTALFSLLGATYGGDGRTTFALPDLRGRSPVGMGKGPGLNDIAYGEHLGQEAVNLTTAQLPPHSPNVLVSVAIPASNNGVSLTAVPSDTAVFGPVAAAGRAGTLYSTDAANVTLKPFNAQVTTMPIGRGDPIGLRNPSIGTNFIIALQGLYPSRS